MNQLINQVFLKRLIPAVKDIENSITDKLWKCFKNAQKNSNEVFILFVF